ncbi:MAG: transcription antitermination factor NusB, partial [Myxococcota bacterium]
MRRRARECALQILYQLDVGGHLGTNPDVGSEMQRYWDSFDPVTPEQRDFAERLVIGVSERVAELDETLDGASNNWKLARMAKVDRNLLRLAAYEILHCADIPRSASINEAIEIGKKFSGGESA